MVYNHTMTDEKSQGAVGPVQKVFRPTFSLWWWWRVVTRGWQMILR